MNVLEKSSTRFGWRGGGWREPSSGGSCGKAFILHYLLPPSWYPRMMATSEILRHSQASPFWPLPGLFCPGSRPGCFQIAVSLSVSACMLSVSDSLRPHTLQPIRLLCPWNYPGNNTGVGCHFLLQGNLPNAGTELQSPVSPALAGGSFIYH